MRDMCTWKNRIEKRNIIALSITVIYVMATQACTSYLPGADQIAQNAPCPPTSGQPERQLRAAWIATVTNLDWPSRPGLPIVTQQQEFLQQLDALQQMRMNAAIVQIKPMADAFYPSQYGPWSEYLTGVQGKDPGYNPLAFLLSETHKRNLEFHAWFNPFRISFQSDINKLAPDHPARQHRDWVVSYGGKLYYNPGVPAARAFVISSILEVVKNYDIDAVHLDDYFYPSRIANQDFPDNATYQRYGAAKFARKDDWRRDNISAFVRTLSQNIKQAKPYVKFGISPFGVWRNKSADPTGSATNAGQTNYDDLYADTRTWLANNWLDYIAPQIYWNVGFPAAPYEELIRWWTNEVKGRNVHLYIGQAAYKIAAWTDPEEMPKQLAYNLRTSAISGSIFFSLKDLLANPRGIKDRLISDIYKQKALVPAMPWLTYKAHKTPHEIASLNAQQTARGVALSWQDVSSDTTAYYALYRLEDSTNTCNLSDPRFLLATVRRDTRNAQQTFVDTTAHRGKTYTYYITALDRLHNESKPSKGQTITLQ